MKKINWVFLCLIVAIFSGCVSGRMSLLDVDLRTPEQIEAYKTEAEAIYKEHEKQEQTDESTTKSSFSWSALEGIINVTKGRIRILSFEWNNRDKKD